MLSGKTEMVEEETETQETTFQSFVALPIYSVFLIVHRLTAGVGMTDFQEENNEARNLVKVDSWQNVNVSYNVLCSHECPLL